MIFSSCWIFFMWNVQRHFKFHALQLCLRIKCASNNGRASGNNRLGAKAIFRKKSSLKRRRGKCNFHISDYKFQMMQKTNNFRLLFIATAIKKRWNKIGLFRWGWNLQHFDFSFCVQLILFLFFWEKIFFIHMWRRKRIKLDKCIEKILSKW